MVGFAWRIVFWAFLAGALAARPSCGIEPPLVGPETEKRFPPLHVPDGFTAALFACDPLVEYPSAIAAGPRPGVVFVAADFMTGLGTEIVRRDEIRLIEDSNGDGYADRSTVFADGFNSIEGLTFHQGVVYAMHSPLLTALRDLDGDGRADERRDLAAGLGLPPEENPHRLHCANGVVVGHDGWLYLALGDHGCNVPRPEGDRLVFHGGGILRCRPDGRDLHVFATGLRNIYDVALDDDLNVFVRDNENDGGDYKIRVCHSFFGADHGYPYDYYERPRQALAPLADLGLGSSAGGLCYREPQFPPEFQGNLFFCEWGKSVVTYRPQAAGAGFASLTENEFASGAPNDPYGFKPTDLAVERDGSLLVADWADGQQPKRGRARIYRITSAAATPWRPSSLPIAIGDLPPLLDSASASVRDDAQQSLIAAGDEGLAAVKSALAKGNLGELARMHVVWIVARVAGADGIADLLRLAATDPSPRVRAQSLRAIGDLADPVLVHHKLDAGPGNAALAEQIARLASGQPPSVLREALIVFGRLRWSESAAWLATNVDADDPFLAHAAAWTLRQSGNWSAVLAWLDTTSASSPRAIALAAASDQFALPLIDGLIDRLSRETEPTRRSEYAGLLSRVCRRPGPWKYWGYRPAPRPANDVAWERTEPIEQALNQATADSDRDVRLAALRSMQREAIAPRTTTLARWLADECDGERLAAILDSLVAAPASDARDALAAAVVDLAKPIASRERSLRLLVAGLDAGSERRLFDLAPVLEDGPILVAVLAELANRPSLEPTSFVASKLTSSDPQVRGAAIDALVALPNAKGSAFVKFLADPHASPRRAAARAMGQLGEASSVDTLLVLAREDVPEVQAACLESLRVLREPRAAPLAAAALEHPATQGAALALLAELGAPEQAAAVIAAARRDGSSEVLCAALGMLSAWRTQAGAEGATLDQAAADLQGESGMLARWRPWGVLNGEDADRRRESWRAAANEEVAPSAVDWIVGRGPEGIIEVTSPAESGADARWLGDAEFHVREANEVEFLAAGSSRFALWLNGERVFEQDGRDVAANVSRFAAGLNAGMNRLLIEMTPATGGMKFRLRFRRPATTASHETLIQAALVQTGDVERGRKLFLDPQKSQCIKCHRVGERGERIGPELTGIGRRLARVQLIESILQPSRAIGPAYRPMSLQLADGRILAGIKLNETADSLQLADRDGKTHTIAKSEIEASQPHESSIMPDGLEKQLTQQEFVDLVTYLCAETLGGK